MSLECMSPKQEDVLAAVIGERHYQDQKWGTPADRPHEVGGYLTLARVHLAKAEAHWSGSRGDEGALDELRKVAAIIVACFEQHGVPSRVGLAEHTTSAASEKQDWCPHSAPLRYCPNCVADPCPIGLGKN